MTRVVFGAYGLGLLGLGSLLTLGVMTMAFAVLLPAETR